MHSSGGVISSELVKQGYSVVVLEKGGHYEAADFREWTESEAFGRAYDQGIIIYMNIIVNIFGFDIGDKSSYILTLHFTLMPFISLFVYYFSFVHFSSILNIRSV